MLKDPKIMKLYLLEDQARDTLINYLADVPFATVVEVTQSLASPNGELRPDFGLEVLVGGENFLVVVEVKTSGQPRVAGYAMSQLRCYRQAFAAAYPVFMAPYIAPRTAEMCRQEGVGYADLAGNCHINFGQIYIHREGNPNPRAQKRGLRSVYSRKASRVLRVLLSDPARAWLLSALAKEADTSLAHTHNVKEALADREWINSGPDGITLQEPEALLSEWAANFEYNGQDRKDLYSSLAISELESEISRFCAREGIGYALTGFSGAERLAPFTRYQRVHAYVQHDISALAEALGLREVSSGANVCLLTPYDEGVFYGMTEIRGSNVVAPVQLYLDLRGIGGRGEEAAEFLLEEVIRSRW